MLGIFHTEEDKLIKYLIKGRGIDVEKEEARIDNGSYYYKLNQELSGETGITPYFVEVGMTGQAVDMGKVREGELKDSADVEQNLG